MTSSTQQQTQPAADPARPLGVRHGHYALAAQLVGEFERATERVLDLTEIPLHLLARFARTLNRAERAALGRVTHLEEEATD